MAQVLGNMTADEKAAFLDFMRQSGSTKEDIELMFYLQTEECTIETKCDTTFGILY